MSKGERPETINHVAQLGLALRAEGIPLSAAEDPDTLCFSTIFGPAAPMFVRWKAADRLVLISQSLPIMVLPTQSDALAATLLRMNRQLDMVGLLADPERGAVWLRTHLYLNRQGALDYPVFLTVVAACVQVVRERLAEVCVALGRQPPPLVEGTVQGLADDQAQALLTVVRSFSE